MNSERTATTATGQPVISYKLEAPNTPTTSTCRMGDISDLDRVITELDLITMDMREDVKTLIDDDKRYSSTEKKLAVIYLAQRADALQRRLPSLPRLIT